MIKAGLNDPTRPLGVYLFIGPTGTGKTEIAKALAEFLFGLQRRLVRLDMSEYQTPDSLERLLQTRASSLTGPSCLHRCARIRSRSSSCSTSSRRRRRRSGIFLQVFDDGRLTDQQGRTADFRRSIIILTSNVGSASLTGPAWASRPSTGAFAPS